MNIDQIHVMEAVYRFAVDQSSEISRFQTIEGITVEGKSQLEK